MNSLNIALVDWTMGSIIIGVFVVVCIILIAVIYNLTRETNESTEASNKEN